MTVRALVVAAAAAVLTVQPAGAGSSQAVTIRASQTTVPASNPILLSGAVAGGRSNEPITIEVKDCGQPAFRGVLALHTEPGGSWSTEFYPGIGTLARARWNDATSAPVALRQVPRIFLRRVSGGRFEISISAKVPFWRKMALFQQRVSGSWRTVRSVVLTEQNAVGSQGIVWTSGRFRAAVPRGRQVRALLPRASARPCYVAGVSNVMRA